MPGPKDIETVMREFREKFPHLIPATSTQVGKHFTDLPEFIEPWIRGAIASVLLQAAQDAAPDIKCEGEFHLGYIVTKEQYHYALECIANDIAGCAKILGE